MTRKEFEKMSPSEQGSLWPLCKSCGHIAQSHDNHISEPQEEACCEIRPGKCPHCGNWAEKVQCLCEGYDGPKDVSALIQYLNGK